MSLAREGLYSTIYLKCGTAMPGTADVVALLTGVDISWSSANKKFFINNQLQMQQLLYGNVDFEGKFRHAYLANATYLGSFLVGTYTWVGSICPRGTTTPALVGTCMFTSGAITNLNAETTDPSIEEHSFTMWNVTLVG